MGDEVSGVTFSFDAAKPALARIDERTVKRLGLSHCRNWLFQVMTPLNQCSNGG